MSVDGVDLAMKIAERIRAASAAIIQEELNDAESINASILLNAAAATAGGVLDIIERRSGGAMRKPQALGLLVILLVNGLEHSPTEEQEESK